MKTKFTLLIITGLFVAAATQAQDRSYDNDRRHDVYKNDFRREHYDDFNYRNRMYNLQQRLMHEMDALDRARECGDWDKAHHEKREIAEINNQMREMNRRRWFDNDDHHYRDHEYNGRF